MQQWISMYLFWHALFSALFALLLYRLVKPNPARLLLLTVMFFGVFPDLDHLLYWRPNFLNMLIPRYLTEGLSFSLRIYVYPFYLHLWLWPLAMITTATIARKLKHREYLVASALGWALHLALDGVIVLI